MMNMLVGVLVEVIKTVSEIEREQNLGMGIDRKTTLQHQQERHDDQPTWVLRASSWGDSSKTGAGQGLAVVFFGMEQT